MALPTAVARAVTTLTFTENGADTNTITIGGKVYTLQASLTNVDGNVKLGGTTAVTIANIVAAVGLGSGAGTLYATAMTANPHCRVRSSTATTIVFEAKVPGTIGNLIPSSDTLAGSSAFTSTVLGSGSGSASVFIEEVLDQCNLNSEVRTLLMAFLGDELEPAAIA
jgi:hypothetical protein